MVPGTGEALQIDRHDVRAIAGGLQLAHHVEPPRGASDFVRGIMRRYAGRQGRWPGLSLVLRQAQPWGMMRHLSHHAHVSLMPRLALTVLTWPHQQSGSQVLIPTPRQPLPKLKLIQGRERQPVRQLMPVVVQEQEQIETLVHRLQTREQMNAMTTEILVQRLVSRGTRVETVGMEKRPAATWRDVGAALSPELKTDTSVSATVPRVRPVPRVLRRPLTVPADAEVVSRFPGPARPATSSDWPAGGARQGTGDSAPLDLNRLTEQVIQSIDRRIIAQRERLGRV